MIVTRGWSPHRTCLRASAMRDAEGDLRLPDSAMRRRSRTQDSAIRCDSFSTDEAEHATAVGAIRSIGYKLSLQCGGKFREGMGNGLRFRITQERRPQTQNKKRKSYYEKSKPSVQASGRTSHPAARPPRDRVYLGSQSGISRRPMLCAVKQTQKGKLP